MTHLKLAKVVSFSSESKKFPASNLLRRGPNDNTGTKWHVYSHTEDKAFVVIKLEKPSIITALDIGNEGSAFVEVLVSNDREKFIPLIPTSSFMSPMESRMNETRNRIRTFTRFDDKSMGKPWNFIKLVCSQPFNKTWPFGVAFFALRGSPESSLNEEGQDSISLGESPINDNGKEEPREVEHDSALQLKINASDHGHKLDSTEARTAHVERGQHSSRYLEPSSSNRKWSKKEQGTSKRRILGGVVMVLSGFRNPLRRQIRDLGLSLGAKYSSHWGPQCTHLISAFSNTPKWLQVAAHGGRIVTKEWLEECQRLQQKLPWKQFKCGNYRDKVKDELTPQCIDQEGSEEAEDGDDGSEFEPTEDEHSEDEHSFEARNRKSFSSVFPASSSSGFQIDELEDFFEGKHFFLDSDIEEGDERDTLTRYIVGHGGNIVASLTLAQCVVSWKPGAHSPQWVVDCHQKNRLV